MYVWNWSEGRCGTNNDKNVRNIPVVQGNLEWDLRIYSGEPVYYSGFSDCSEDAVVFEGLEIPQLANICDKDTLE